MIKIKSISKRALAVILATLMLLSSGIVGTLAANIDMIETGASVVYFNNTAGWSDVYCHMWNGGTGTNWPGTKMTQVSGTDYWSINVGSNQSCIFHNNSGIQTGDLTVNSGQIYHYDLSMWDVYPPVYIDTIYLDTSNVNWSTINCHKWIPDGTSTDWPGIAMTHVVDNIYSISRGDATYCIFNNKTSSTDGGNTQTNDLAILRNGQNCFVLNSNGTGGEWTTYAETVKHSVEFNVNNTVSKTTANAGEACPYSGSVPTKTGNAQYSYTFAGWRVNDGDLISFDEQKTYVINEDTVFVAEFTQSINNYTVTFNSDGGTSVASQTIAYGSTVTEPTDPTKDKDAQYTYTFSHWKDSNGNKWNFETNTITGNTTLTAVYDTTVNKYTVTFVDYNDDVFDTQQVEYGSYATAPDTSNIPTPVGHNFANWDKAVASTQITGDTTFTAMYDPEEYDYTLTIVPSDGTGGTVTGYDSTKVSYGDSITLTATPTDLYMFNNDWTVEGTCDYVINDDGTLTISNIASNITVTAEFTKRQTYTITVNQSGFNTENDATYHSIKFDNAEKFSESPDGTKTITDVLAGEHTIYICGPVNHYISGFKVNDADVMADAKEGQSEWVVSYTFNVAANTTIDVEYHYNPTITVKTDVEGVAGDNLYTDTVCNYNGSKSITIPEKEGYYISGIEGLGNEHDFTDGKDTTLRSKTITLTNVTKDVVATVYYTDLPTFTVTVTADTTNGTVSPNGTKEYEPDEEVTFTAAPNSGYYAQWYVNGAYAAKGNTYTHTVTADVTIEVKFVAQEWDNVLFLEDQRASGSRWTNYYAYIWSGSTYPLGGWPGGTMTYVTTTDDGYPVYAVYVPVDADQIASYNVIFTCNAGDANKQTATIAMQRNSNYYILTAQGKTDGQYTSSGSWTYSDMESGLVATKTVYGVHGSEISAAEKGSYDNATYRGTTTFPTQTSVLETDNSNNYYAKATVVDNASVDIITTVIDEDFVVDGWVINGTKFVSANATGTAKEFRGTIPADYLDETSNDAVAVYSHSTSWFTAHPDVGTLTIFADISKTPEIEAYTWGEYISAYTWTQDASQSGGYEQFGEWTGQLMIPLGEDNPGVYKTTLEKKGIDGNDVKGITFTNFGGNSICNPSVGFLQTYDYYEFIKLQDKDNIIFVLQPTDNTSNQDTIGDGYNSTTSANAIENVGLFTNLVDYGNQEMDIYRTELTDAQVESGAVGLYVVRTGPYDAGTTTNSVSIDGEYYVDCFVYKADKTYIGRCKSYELLDINTLANTKGQEAFKELVDNKSDYEGKLVKVAYEYPDPLANNNTRVDGEWYGTDETSTVTLTARVAKLTDAGYEVATSNTADYGTASIGGKGVWEGAQGTLDIQGAVSGSSDYKFVGWYHGTLDAAGNVIVDTSKTIISTFTDQKFNAYNNSYYVAVFEELESGTFTVSNFSYEGNPNNPAAPPVFNKIGRDASYRYVKIDKIDKNGNVLEAGVKSDIYTDYPWASTIDVTEGDILSITIYTTPKYDTDKVYAWYMEAPEADGTMNYEEVGTDVIGNFGLGEEATFTFTYVITENYQKNMIIYSDILTKTAEITLDYRYYNRYGSEMSYTKNYTLLGEELSNNRPSNDTIRAYAPYVVDLYKDVKWTISKIEADSTGTRFILEADYDEDIEVNVSVNGKSGGKITGKFNEAISLYATTYDSTVTNKGFWYVENGEDGKFTDGVDDILSYGTYYGLVFTKDMDINYVTEENLDFKVILNDPIYGREQATDVDKVYTDFIINYLVPYFSGDSLVEGGDPVYDVENKNAPIQLEVYAEAAGVTVEYGMIHQLINTFGDNGETNKKEYFNTEALTGDEIKAFEDFLGSGNSSAMDSSGNLFNYKYTGSNEDLTNKNRALMTFITNNTASNRNRYYRVVAYLAIKDGENTTYYFSNVETFNIKEFVENNSGSDITE